MKLSKVLVIACALTLGACSKDDKGGCNPNLRVVGHSKTVVKVSQDNGDVLVVDDNERELSNEGSMDYYDMASGKLIYVHVENGPNGSDDSSDQGLTVYDFGSNIVTMAGVGVRFTKNETMSTAENTVWTINGEDYKKALKVMGEKENEAEFKLCSIESASGTFDVNESNAGEKVSVENNVIFSMAFRVSGEILNALRNNSGDF